MSNNNNKPLLTAKQAKRREELRLEMLRHMKEEARYRIMIEKIDSFQEARKNKWIIGNCFAMKSETGTRAGDAGYCRVDKYRTHKRPTGIKLYVHKNKVSSIEFNSAAIWEEDILRGKKISHSLFNKYLEQARILTYVPEIDTIREKERIKKPPHVNFADKIKKIMPTVSYILKMDLDSRDDDNLLCTLLWELQGAKPNTNFKAFKKNIIIGKLSTPESITRTRRLLQAKYPDLRGKYYKERHEQDEALKHQLRFDFFD